MSKNSEGAVRFAEWLGYVSRMVQTVDSARGAALGPAPAPPVPPVVSASETQGANVLFCAPHPDDECLSAALGSRLRLEAGARVTNIAITLGSDPAQRPRRRRELVSAHQVLGFELLIPTEPGAASADGFEDVHLSGRDSHPEAWAKRVGALAEIFDSTEPEAVFAPHEEDFNSTHIGTHELVSEALDAYLARHPESDVLFIETEFWHQLADPNLMVGITPELAAVQIVAAAEHGGEMTRMPYHLLHPCRLMDNVRRGSEVVGGQGAAVQPFVFAELYRVSFRRGREVIGPTPGNHILLPSEKASLDWLRAEFSGQGDSE
ncbi:MAG TPA: PIG-L family deacetylase [Terriglobia bacterium]|nr:PIG-L family deacetylase [Terriglobia bacterium]